MYMGVNREIRKGLWKFLQSAVALVIFLNECPRWRLRVDVVDLVGGGRRHSAFKCATWTGLLFFFQGIGECRCAVQTIHVGDSAVFLLRCQFASSARLVEIGFGSFLRESKI